ncbi:MAG: sulfotransferase [Magnetococcales bacterium]|nr:sulfotransferase [Magnetococcales bacterium]
MIDYLYDKLLERQPTRIILILGSGRSGTNWLGYTLGAHPDVRVTIENQKILKWSVDLALWPEKRYQLLQKLISRYKKEYILSFSKHYLDKSHPNIWSAPELASALPNARFIGIQRNPYASVSSMLRHPTQPGVLVWHERWKEFPIPNAFLGIDQEMAEEYDSFSLTKQCAIRWQAHKERMDRLRQLMGSRLLVIDYDRFFLQNELHLEQLRQFIGLNSPIPSPTIRHGSLNRWKKLLTPEQCHEIATVVGFGPEEVDSEKHTPPILRARAG